mgnify:CR=1 FL=1
MAEEIPKQTTPEQETTAPTGKKKKEKGKSFLETMREIDAKEQQQEEAREAAMQAQLAEQEKREKEAYEKKIQQDRIELIRLKQGVITESDRIAEEHPEKKKMPLGKRAPTLRIARGSFPANRRVRTDAADGRNAAFRARGSFKRMQTAVVESYVRRGARAGFPESPFGRSRFIFCRRLRSAAFL